jgi:hypothetical protein
MNTLEKIITEYEIIPELIYNMDETMLEVGTGHMKVISKKDAPRAYTIKPPNSEHITMVLCITAAGDYVKPLCILPLKELPRLHPLTETFFHLAGQENGSITKQLLQGWTVASFLQHVNQARQIMGKPDSWALLVVDGHNSRDHMPTILTMDAHKVIVQVIPAHSSTVLQPLDLTCNWEAKRLLTTYFTIKKNEGRVEMRVRLLHTAALVLQMALAPLVVQRGFARAGIWPLSPGAPLKSSLVRDPHEDVIKQAPAKKPKRIGISGKILNERVDAVATSSIKVIQLPPPPVILALPPPLVPNISATTVVSSPIQFVRK